MNKYTIRYTHAEDGLKSEITRTYPSRVIAEHTMMKNAHFDYDHKMAGVVIEHILELDTGEIHVITIPPKPST